MIRRPMQSLFDTLKRKLSTHIEIVEDDHHLDDPQFAMRVGETNGRFLLNN